MKRYVRTVARNTEDVKNEQYDQRKILQKLAEQSTFESGQPKCIGSNRHPVFEKYVTMPLSEMQDFHDFEVELEKRSIRNNLVTINDS